MAQPKTGAFVPCSQCGKQHYRPGCFMNKKRFFCSMECSANGRGGSLDPLKALFMKINKTDTCWLWTGARQTNGYGKVGFRVDGKSVFQAAHRRSWTLHNGPIPKGLLVLHKCDVPLCVRPDHLFLGTDADNCADKMAKGRWGHGGWKLTPEQVLEIQRDYRRTGKRKGNGTELAAKYGVSSGTILRHAKKVPARPATSLGGK